MLVGLGVVTIVAALLYCVGAFLGPIASQHAPILLSEFDASNRFEVMLAGLVLSFLGCVFLWFALAACYVAYVVLGLIGGFSVGVLRDVALRVVHFAHESK